MFAATILLRLGRLSRSKIWLHGVSPDGKPSGYSLPSPLKRAEIAVFRRLGYISPRIHSRAKRRWTRNLDLLRLSGFGLKAWKWSRDSGVGNSVIRTGLPCSRSQK